MKLETFILKWKVLIEIGKCPAMSNFIRKFSKSDLKFPTLIRTFQHETFEFLDISN